MSILTAITSLFPSAVKLVDELHTSTEEKMTLKTALIQIQSGIVSQIVALESKVLEAKTAIIVQEAKSDSWLTKSWRPIVMLAMVASVMAYWFGITPTDPETGLSTIPLEVVNRMFSLVQIGVGGYVTSRGVEKVVPKVLEAMKAKEQV